MPFATRYDKGIIAFEPVSARLDRERGLSYSFLLIVLFARNLQFGSFS
jgi:hypothetical protein